MVGVPTMLSVGRSRDWGLVIPGALRGILLLLGLVIVTCGKVQHPPGQPEPSFGDRIENITVIKGRDITFTCVVKHLGQYKVGWVKADTKAIQAIHHQVVTHNPRVSVTYRDRTTWNLHIRNVQEDDRGLYMCQVNTDPMMAMMANLKVVVPPEIVDNETSRDTEVKEGDSVKLSCKARGFPQPVVSWQREGGKGIVFRDLGKTVNSSEGGELELTAVERSDMGPYLCIAKNGIPPSVSKRILLRVNFSPKLHVPIDMMGSPLGKNVSIKCTIEASPRSVNTWRKDPGEQMIISSPKYNVSEYHEAFYVTHLSLTIRNFSKEDVNTYRCVASNSLGSTDSSVHVYEIPQEPRVNKNKDDSRLENHIPNSEYESNTKNEFAFSTDLEDTKVDATYRDPYPPGSGLQPPGKEKEVPSKEANSRQQPSGGITFPIFNSSQSSLASWGSFGLLLLCHVLAGFRALLF